MDAFDDPDDDAQEYEAEFSDETVATVEVDGDTLTVRRLVEEDGRRILRVADPKWPDMVVTADNETLIRGTVVLVGEAV